jgi:hypothetical protein
MAWHLFKMVNCLYFYTKKAPETIQGLDIFNQRWVF